MKKPINFRIEQHENVLLVKDIEIDDSMRGCDFIFSKGTVDIKSEYKPELNNGVLHLKGDGRISDKEIPCYSYYDKAEATKYKQAFEQARDEYNESLTFEKFGMEINEDYWFIDSDGHVVEDVWYEGVSDIFKYNQNNVFKTKAEAERKLEILNVIWENEIKSKEHKLKAKTPKFAIYYNANTDELDIIRLDNALVGVSSYATEETAREVAAFIGKDDFIKHFI